MPEAADARPELNNFPAIGREHKLNMASATAQLEGFNGRIGGGFGGGDLFERELWRRGAQVAKDVFEADIAAGFAVDRRRKPGLATGADVNIHGEVNTIVHKVLNENFGPAAAAGAVARGDVLHDFGERGLKFGPVFADADEQAGSEAGRLYDERVADGLLYPPDGGRRCVFGNCEFG